MRKHKEEIACRENDDFESKGNAHKALEFLYKSYEPRFWYWEVVETVRRLFFTFLLEFGFADEPMQVVYSVKVLVSQCIYAAFLFATDCGFHTDGCHVYEGIL